MKKLIIAFIISIFALPAFAACPINGSACTSMSNWDSKSLQQKYVPDRLQNIQRTDAFLPSYKKPYSDALINTEDSINVAKPPVNDYNSNCQFGVCLPGVEPGDVLE